MAKLNDLTGKAFGNWVALYRNGSTANKAAVWRCKCGICGKEHDVVGSSLLSGASTKCRSCVPTIALKKPNRNTRLYHIYTAMKQRCYNPKTNRYADYGGRGISVCDQWKDSFDAFADWAFSSGYADGLSIDRIDANGNYEPSNCRWIPINAQASNRRNVILVEYGNEFIPLQTACLNANIPRSTVDNYRRKHPELSVQEAFDYYVSRRAWS